VRLSRREPVPEVQRFVYGRRRGHKLRSGRKALFESLLPRIEIQLEPNSGVMLEPRSLFPAGITDVWLEIGFGAGEHLAAQARARPDVGLIGCEPFVNGVASLLGRVAAEGLGNVRVFTDDARLLIGHLAPASIGRLFILYPDPWPKRRHHKRRIVGPRTLGRFADIMKDGAELRLATDHADYARWMLRYLTAHPAFAWTARGPSDWRQRQPDWPATRYEAKAIAEGRRPFYFCFRRLPRAEKAPDSP
jgi:tRNA (guanine-N7-)-methyltransferase